MGAFGNSEPGTPAAAWLPSPSFPPHLPIVAEARGKDPVSSGGKDPENPMAPAVLGEDSVASQS